MSAEPIPDPERPEPAVAPPRPADHWAFVLVLVLTVAAVVGFARAHPPVKFRGDEEPYARIAHEEYGATPPLLRSLPGFLGFHYWPPLSFATYSCFATEELEQHFAGTRELDAARLNQAIAGFLRPIVWMNALWLLIATGCVYGLALAVGARPLAAAAATALFSLNPRVLFYVQALWPELLHFAVFLPALLLLTCYLRRRPATRSRLGEYGPLIAASCLFAYAALTKGIASLFCLLLLGLFLWWHRGSLRTRATLLTLVALFVPFHAILTIQKARNLGVADAFAISSNSWVNIEKGLIPASVAVEAGYKNTSERYAQAAPDQMGRERASRQRVREYLTSQPPLAVLGHLLRQYRNLPGNSFLQRGIFSDRWSDPAGLITWEAVAAGLSWVTLVLGALGTLAFWRRHRAAAVLALFLAYYLGALVVVGWNERFLVQALPVLAVFTALVLERVFHREPAPVG